ncbi:hypothetical protein A2U01_0108979, partial [Trifolium medium]|nr:hypothetical protein [Trifolium medium]
QYMHVEIEAHVAASAVKFVGTLYHRGGKH